MIVLYVLASVLLIISFFVDKQKTLKALKIGWKKFMKIIPAFGSMLVMISIVLYLVPESMILKYLGNNNIISGIGIASFFGSITVMPGFIAYPLCGVLLKQGVPYAILAAFSTTLMLVGILTFPIEREYLGTKVTIIRNIIGFIMSIAVALIIGIVYKEIIL